MKIRFLNREKSKLEYVEVDDYAMLPTGRKDVNNRLIYTGDVLIEDHSEFIYYLWVVSFGYYIDEDTEVDGQGFYLKRIERYLNGGFGDFKSRIFKTYSITRKDLSKLSLIGNIYENKQLFKPYISREEELKYKALNRKSGKLSNLLYNLGGLDYESG